jgi:hypothetical protein
MLEARTNLHLNAVRNSVNGYLVDRMVASVTAALRCRYVVFDLPMFKKIIKDSSCFVDFAHATHNEPTAPNIVKRAKFETIVIAL